MIFSTVISFPQPHRSSARGVRSLQMYSMQTKLDDFVSEEALLGIGVGSVSLDNSKLGLELLNSGI